MKKNLIEAFKHFSFLTITVLLFSISSCSAYQVEKKPKTINIVPEATVEKKGIKIFKDQRYGEVPKGIEKDTPSDRTLDLYIPTKNADEKLPIFVFIHGGGFGGGDKASKGNEALCLKMASHGFAVVSINYYLTLKHEKTSGASCTANMSQGIPVDGFHPKLNEAIKNASDDTQEALKWINDNANLFSLNKSSVAISGGSAGAMTALYTAYISNQKNLPIKAVVNLWGGLENSNQIKKNAPPLLTFHGDQDKLINVDYAYALEKQMKEIGNFQSETHIFKRKGHAIYNFITEHETDRIAEFLRETMK